MFLCDSGCDSGAFRTSQQHERIGMMIMLRALPEPVTARLLQAVLLIVGLILRIAPRLNDPLRQWIKNGGTYSAEIRTADGRSSRTYFVADGVVRSRRAAGANADVVLEFSTAREALKASLPPVDWSERLHAGKNFKFVASGETSMSIISCRS
jgi:hypothetical protein